VWVAKTPDVTYGTNGFYLDFQDDTEVEAFNTVLYRGTGGTQSITGMGFKPDLVWVKRRDSNPSHNLSDAVRGASQRLFSDTTAAEDANSGIVSFDSDGFTIDGIRNATGSNGSSYVAWGWKAGDSNVSNTDGSITSTVRANDTYGFSIVSYTGNGSSSQSFGHGLSSVPDWVIIKDRSEGVQSWTVWHTSLGTSKYLNLNNTNSVATDSNRFPSDPSTSVVNIGSSQATNKSGNDYIAYCWAEKSGYSKFGSYTGNGTTSNSITGLGFKPAWLMVKRTDSADNWAIYDATRDAVDPREKYLYADSSNAEATFSTAKVSFDDDGFTWLGAVNFGNASGGTYIYAAFADTREAAFWLDQSGNDNDWQPVNLDHNDTVADSPTDNFCTLNPLNLGGGTLSDGNLNWSISSSTGLLCTATMAFDIESTTHQFYWEVTLNSGQTVIGIAPTTLRGSDTGRAGSYGYYVDGNKYSGVTPSSYGSSYTSGDTIGVAVGSGKITFYKNGVSQGDAFTGLTGIFVPFIAEVTCNVTANFGQQPFKYDPPA
jgi:hypothetical protein